MKEYRFTSQNFILPGESGDTDAVMDPQDLAELKKLAGITPLGETALDNSQNPNRINPLSPVGSNISVTGTEKRQLEKQHGIRPGTDEWFKLWFSRPYLTGEKPVGDDPAPKVKKH